MKWLLSLVLVLLAVGTLRVVGCGDEEGLTPCERGRCFREDACDDGDPCTHNLCAWGGPEPFCVNPAIDCTANGPALHTCQRPGGLCHLPYSRDCVRFEFDVCDPTKRPDLVCGEVTFIREGLPCDAAGYCLLGDYQCREGRCRCL
jgi:hypothetical protein